MSDKRPEVQMQALIALGKIGPDAASAVPQVSAFLKQGQDATKYAAAFALGSIGSPAGADALKAAGKSNDPMLKTVSVWALAKVLPNDKAVLRNASEQLVASLKSSDEHVREAAARGLADLKPDPELVRGALVAALTDEDPVVRGNVVEAISAIGAKVVPDVVKGLDKPELCSACAAILARIGPDAKAALPALAAALKEKAASEHEADHAFCAERWWPSPQSAPIRSWWTLVLRSCRAMTRWNDAPQPTPWARLVPMPRRPCRPLRRTWRLMTNG